MALEEEVCAALCSERENTDGEGGVGRGGFGGGFQRDMGPPESVQGTSPHPRLPIDSLRAQFIVSLEVFNC